MEINKKSKKPLFLVPIGCISTSCVNRWEHKQTLTVAKSATIIVRPMPVVAKLDSPWVLAAPNVVGTSIYTCSCRRAPIFTTIPDKRKSLLIEVQGGDSGGMKRDQVRPRSAKREEAHRPPRRKCPLGTEINTHYDSL